VRRSTRAMSPFGGSLEVTSAEISMSRTYCPCSQSSPRQSGKSYGSACGPVCARQSPRDPHLARPQRVVRRDEALRCGRKVKLARNRANSPRRDVQRDRRLPFGKPFSEPASDPAQTQAFPAGICCSENMWFPNTQGVAPKNARFSMNR